MNNWEYTYKRFRIKVALQALIYIIIAVGSFWLTWIGDILIFPFHSLTGVILGVAGLFSLIKIFELICLLISRGKYIYRLGNGLAFCENKDVKMMEEMSVNGYSLLSVNKLGFYKFQQDEPRELSYSVDYNSIGKDKENLDEYIEIFKNSGWEYVCGDCAIHYFRAPKGTVPIYTDNSNMSEKYNVMKKISVWTVVIGGIVGIISLGVALIINNSMPFGLFAILLCVGGGGLGLAIAMSLGIVLNYRKVTKLRQRQNA